MDWARENKEKDLRLYIGIYVFNERLWYDRYVGLVEKNYAYRYPFFGISSLLLKYIHLILFLSFFFSILYLITR